MKKYSSVGVVSLLAPQQLSGAGATYTKYIDLAEANSCLIAINIGAMGGTSPTISVKLQEASANPQDSASYSDVAASNYGVSTFANAAANTMVYATYTGTKRYIVAVITLGGTSPTAYVSAVGLTGEQTQLPPIQATTGTVTIT